MGTKYSSQTASGYNATPPADDGTVSEANKVKYSTVKTKLADPVKTLSDAINTALETHFDNGPVATATNLTLLASHYAQVIEASGATTTLTLSDANTLTAGWWCEVRNTGTADVTITGATTSDTFNGIAFSTSTYALKVGESFKIVVTAAATGFIAIGPSKRASGEIESTDAGATVGPNFDLYRNSASPAASDVLGAINFYGEDSAGNKQKYGDVHAEIKDPTSTSEDGKIVFQTTVSGTDAARGEINAGLQMGSVTDQGAGTISAENGIFDGTDRVHSAAGEYNSGNQTITSAALLTLAHGLPQTPTRVTCLLKCTTGEHGFNVGDTVLAPLTSSDAATDTQGFALIIGAANIEVRFGTNANVFTYKNKTTGAGVALTNASWALIVIAQ